MNFRQAIKLPSNVIFLSKENNLLISTTGFDEKKKIINLLLIQLQILSCLSFMWHFKQSLAYGKNSCTHSHTRSHTRSHTHSRILTHMNGSLSEITFQRKQKLKEAFESILKKKHRIQFVFIFLLRLKSFLSCAKIDFGGLADRSNCSSSSSKRKY